MRNTLMGIYNQKIGELQEDNFTPEERDKLKKIKEDYESGKWKVEKMADK